jgi:ERCC4-type nuclease
MSNSLYEYKQHEQNLGRLCIQKNTLETNYMKSADLIERDMNDIDRRISMAKSDIKREILKKQYQYLIQMTNKLDEDFTTQKGEFEEIIEETKGRMVILNEQIKGEKNSLDYNIDQLKEYMNNPGTYNMSQVLEKIVNSLEIIRDKKGKKKKKSTSSA